MKENSQHTYHRTRLPITIQTQLPPRPPNLPRTPAPRLQHSRTRINRRHFAMQDRVPRLLVLIYGHADYLSQRVGVWVRSGSVVYDDGAEGCKGTGRVEG